MAATSVRSAPRNATPKPAPPRIDPRGKWGDKHLSDEPPRLLRRRADKKPVVAALVPKGAAVLAADEVETVPGPGSRPTELA
jgi:hypothetical protein